MGFTGSTQLTDGSVTTPKLANGAVVYSKLGNDVLFRIAPIGTILPWLKSFDGTPTLPEGWVECNGQTISDPNSPYNGKTLPNLNGENRFLRGNSTSGGTGGTTSISITHNHKWAYHTTSSNGQAIESSTNNTYDSTNRSFDSSGNAKKFSREDDYLSITGDYYTDNNTISHDNQPQYYNVVWVIRIK